MKTIRTEILIDAAPEAVWRTLTDFAEMPQWNPFIQRIEGELQQGERLRVRISNGRGGGMSFRPTVLAARPAVELRWRGRFLMPGLFDGEHAFELVPEDGNRTRFIHSEKFTGLLVRLAGSALDGTEAGFRRMNEALKERVERRQGQAPGPAAA